MDHGAEVHNSLKVATQFDRVITKAYRIRAFIGRSIEYELRGHVAFARILVQAAYRVLRAVLVTASQEGCGDFDEGAIEIHQDVVQIRTYQLMGEVNLQYSVNVRGSLVDMDSMGRRACCCAVSLN